MQILLTKLIIFPEKLTSLKVFKIISEFLIGHLRIFFTWNYLSYFS